MDTGFTFPNFQLAGLFLQAQGFDICNGGYAKFVDGEFITIILRHMDGVVKLYIKG